MNLGRYPRKGWRAYLDCASSVGAGVAAANAASCALAVVAWRLLGAILIVCSHYLRAVSSSPAAIAILPASNATAGSLGSTAAAV